MSALLTSSPDSQIEAASPLRYRVLYTCLDVLYQASASNVLPVNTLRSTYTPKMATHVFGQVRPLAPSGPPIQDWSEYYHNTEREYITWARTFQHPLMYKAHWRNHHLLRVLQVTDQRLAASSLPAPQQADAQRMLFERDAFKFQVTQTKGNGARTSNMFSDVELDACIELAAEIVISGKTRLNRINFQYMKQPHKFALFEEIDKATQWWREKTMRDVQAALEYGGSGHLQTLPEDREIVQKGMEMDRMEREVYERQQELEDEECLLQAQLGYLQRVRKQVEAERRALQKAKEEVETEKRTLQTARKTSTSSGKRKTRDARYHS
jgi:hypothetical protein